jgi:hypothetical protein
MNPPELYRPFGPRFLLRWLLLVTAAWCVIALPPAGATHSNPPPHVVAVIEIDHLQTLLTYRFELRTTAIPGEDGGTYVLAGRTHETAPTVADIRFRSAELLPSVSTIERGAGGFVVLRKGVEICSVDVESSSGLDTTLVVHRDGGPRLRVRCRVLEWAMSGPAAPGLPQVLALLSASQGPGPDVVSPCDPNFAQCVHQAELQCFPMRSSVSYSCDVATGFVQCSWDCVRVPPAP